MDFVSFSFLYKPSGKAAGKVSVLLYVCGGKTDMSGDSKLFPLCLVLRSFSKQLGALYLKQKSLKL